MRLPRQLLNEVPVPGLLMLSAELTAWAHTLPDLQPRRWPDDAVWAIRQLYVLACTFTTLPMAAAADQAIAAAAAAAEPLPASLELFAADIKELMNQVATDVAAANAAMRTGMPLPMVPPAPAIGRFASLVAASSGASGGSSGRGVGLGLSNKSAGLAPLEDANLQYVTFSPRLFEVLRRAQLRYYRTYMSAVLPGVYSAPVEALLLACPQDLLMPQVSLYIYTNERRSTPVQCAVRIAGSLDYPVCCEHLRQLGLSSRNVSRLLTCDMHVTLASMGHTNV